MFDLRKSIAGEMIERFIKHDIVGSGAQMAYYILLFIFPLLIFIIAVLGYLSLPVDDATFFMSLIVPSEAIAFFSKYIEYILTEKQANLIYVSLFATFWTASNALKVLINSMNRAYEVEENRSYIKRKVLAVPFTLLIALCITAALFIPILGKNLLLWISHFVYISSTLMEYLRYLRWVMAIFTIFNVMLVVYFIAPNIKIKIAHIIPGAALATTGWIVMSMFFSLYFSIFNGYAVIYGSIGAFIVLMIWLLWSSIIIIAGGELNAILEGRRSFKIHKRNRENKDILERAKSI
jgi:membrane protein